MPKKMDILSKKDLANRLMEYDVDGKSGKSENYSTHAKACEVIEDVFDVVVNAIYEGKTVSIHRFGKLSVVDRPARKGRNPKTGEAVEIPAKRVVRFKPSSILKKDIQEIAND